MSKQLSLPVLLKDQLSFENFVVGDNQQLLDHLISVAKAEDQTANYPWLTYCFAETGLGKSHLLFATCFVAEQHQQSCVYLSFRDKQHLAVEMLEGLEAYDLVCLDDIECIEQDLPWQIALFDLINRVKEQDNTRLILCSRFPLQALPLELPDLLSRLSWGVSFRVAVLNELERCQALILRAEQRGLLMPLEVARYLLNHLQRDLPALIKCLDKLDELSLQQQRKLTIPFVKSTLNL
jgi:DnaA family protein